jgi:S1-C subfamily serine protease
MAPTSSPSPVVRLGVQQIVTVGFPAASLVGTCFLPWLAIRLPGLKHRYLSLLELSGGRLMFGFSTAFIAVGLVVALVRARPGFVVASIGIGALGWLAGLAVLAIGIIRSLIPDLALFGIDIADGLIGQGPGVVLALGSAILLSSEAIRWFEPHSQHRRHSFNVFGLIAFVLVVAISAANHARWAVADSSLLGSQMGISGDSLFASVVVGILTWIAGALAAAQLLHLPRLSERALGVVLIVIAALKFSQLIMVWAGTGIARWILPDSLGSVADVSLQPAFWLSAALSIAALVLGVLGLVAGRHVARVSTVQALRVVPAIALLIATGITLVLVDGEPERTAGAEEPAVDEPLISPQTTSQAESDGVVTSTSGVTPSEQSSLSIEDLVKATAYVVLYEGDEGCAAGSGVVIGDGTYILTNAHVVVPDGELPPTCAEVGVWMTRSASQEPDDYFDADIVEVDEGLDLAVLRLRGARPGQFPVPETNFDQLALGSAVTVLGYPGVGGGTVTLTEGVISGFWREFDTEFYKVSATLNPGNSGGPMVDSQGRLVGVATAVSRAEIDCTDPTTCLTDGTNLGLVRPLAYARRLMERAIK